MPLTDDELRNNYYLAVIVYLCDYGGVPYTKTDPSTGDDWDFMLVDDGQPPHPNPTIGTWGVEAKPAPTDAQMREDTDMSMIDAAFEALFGSEAVKEKKARQVIERRKLALREAKLARETAARLEAERQEAERAEAERAEAERAEKERAEAEFLERELAEVAEAAEASGREAASVEAIFGETGEAAETAEASGPGAASAGAALSGEAGGPESAEAALSGEAGGPESAADFWPAVGAADSPADADAAPPAPAALEQEGGADAGESAAQSDPLPDPERARAEAEAPGAAETPPLVFSDPLVPLAFQIIEPTEHVAFSAVPAAGVPVPDPAAAASLSEATVRRRTAPNLAPFGDSEDDDLGAQGVLEDWSLVS